MKRTKDFKVNYLQVAGAVLMMCFLFVQMSLVTFAAEGKVTAQAAKIRATASTSSAQVGSAVRGEKYTITGEETGSDGYVWYKVTFDGNKTGYIRSDLMEKSGEITTPGTTINPTVSVTEVQPVSATITGSSVRVRSDASTSGSIIAGVVRNHVVTITGTAKDSQGMTWYRVTYSSENGEVTGFIREDFLSVSGTITPVTDTPVVNDPVVNDPVVNDPGTSETTRPGTPSATIKDFEVVEEEGVWKLVDNKAGKKYNAASLIEANRVNPPRIEELEKKVKSQSGWIVFLVILVIGLGVLATLLFLKISDARNDAYMAAVERDTIRQRQGQKANNNATRPKSAMQTVGAGGNSGNKQGVPKAGGATNGKPVQQKSSNGGTPQTVKVSNPADTRAPKPVNQQQRPAGAPQQQRPSGVPQSRAAGTQGGNVQRPMNAGAQQARPAGQGGQQPRPAGQGGQQPRPAGQGGQQPRPAVSQQNPAGKQSWQSKNFVSNDEEGEFEFEFLNWDGNEDN